MKLVVLLCGSQTNPDFRDVSGVISQITRIPGFLPNSGTTDTYDATSSHELHIFFKGGLKMALLRWHTDVT